MDELLPPILRDNRLFMNFAARALFKDIDIIDFKEISSNGLMRN